MTLIELHEKVKDLKLKGNVIVPFRKSEYNICRVGQFSVVPDLTIDFTESEVEEIITVEQFVDFVKQAFIRGQRTAIEYASVELYNEERDTIYGLSSVYVAEGNLYLIIG